VGYARKRKAAGNFIVDVLLGAGCKMSYIYDWLYIWLGMLFALHYKAHI
jgi:hypothetical protein